MGVSYVTKQYTLRDFVMYKTKRYLDDKNMTISVLPHNAFCSTWRGAYLCRKNPEAPLLHYKWRMQVLKRKHGESGVNFNKHSGFHIDFTKSKINGDIALNRIDKIGVI